MQWQNKDGVLFKTITFSNQTELAQFVLKIAQISDVLNHHADMCIRYNELTLELKTHDSNEITQLDYELAEKIDGLI